MPVYKMASQNFRIQFMFGGKNYVRSAKTPDRRLAEAMEAKWRVELLEKRVFGKKTDILVSTLIANYLAQPLAANTLRNATSFFDAFTQEVDTDVNASDFDQAEVHEYVVRRLKVGIKPASIRTQLLYFSAAWKLCNADVYDCPELKLPSLQPSAVKTDYLTIADEDMLFAYLRERSVRGCGATEDYRDEMADVFAILLDTGIRHNELCRLQWRDVNLRAKTLEIYRGKTGTPAVIHMTNRVHQILQRRSEAKKHETWVFTDARRTGHRRDSTTYLNEVMVKAGLKASVHLLRHTYASRLLAAGFTLPEISELLGHRSLQSTIRYTHLEKNATAGKAAAVLNAHASERLRLSIEALQ